jgi:TP901 family phage tail tape measure protein
VKSFTDFEQVMSGVRAVTGSTNAEMKTLEQLAFQLGKSTIFSALDVGEAEFALGRMGWKTDRIVPALPGIVDLAAAGKTDLADAADIVASTMNIFKMQAGEAAHVADVFAAAATNSATTITEMGTALKYTGSLAGTLGYKLDDVALAMGLMADRNIEGSMAGTSLRNLFENLVNPTEAEAKVMKNLGISYKTSSGEVKPFLTLMKELRSTFAGKTDADIAELETKLGGIRGANAIAGIVGATDEAFARLVKAIEESEGSARRMSAILLDNLAGDVDILKDEFTTMAIESIDRGLSKHMRAFVQYVTSKMPDIQKAVTGFMDVVDEKISRFRERYQALTKTMEWQNADGLLGKIKLGWDKLIAEPFAEWWDGSGRAWFADKMHGVGKEIGLMVSGLFGVDYGGIADEGISIGGAFANGFLEGMKGVDIAGGIMSALGAAGKLIFSNPVTSGLAAMWFGGKVLGGVSSGLKIAGLLKDAGIVGAGASAVAGGAATAGAGAATAGVAGGAAATAGTGVLSGLYALAGTVVPLIPAVFSLVSGFRDIFERDKLISGITKIGLPIIGGIVGSIFPGVGTALGMGIGAGIAGIGTFVVEKIFGKPRDEFESSLRTLGDSYDEAQERVDRLNTAPLDELIGLYPDLLSQYDAENGMLEEKLGIMREMAAIEERENREKLHDLVNEGQTRLPEMDRDMEQTKAQILQTEEEKTALMRKLPDAIDLESQYRLALKARDKGLLDDPDVTFGELENRVAMFNEKYGTSLEPVTFAQGAASHNIYAEIDKKNQDIQRGQERYTQLQSEYGALYGAEYRLVSGDYGDKTGRSLDSDLTLWQERQAWQEERERLKRQLGGESLYNDGFVNEKTRLAYEEANQHVYEYDQKLEQIGGGYLSHLRDAIAQIEKINEKYNQLPDEKRIKVIFEVSDQTGGLGKFYPTSRPTEHANGGILSSPHLGLVAEAGPEAIIPLSAGKRGRARSIWEEAGERIGASKTSDSVSSLPPVVIENISFTVDAETNATADEIMDVIRANIGGITGDVARRVTDALKKSIANMPKEAV